MNYILFAHYAGFDMDDPEEFVNNSWYVGETDSTEEAERLAKKEIDDFIEEEIANRFDDPEEYPERREDIEEEVADFRKEFETSITSIRIPSDKMETIATLHHDGGGFYYEDMKVEVIKVGE